MSKETIALVHLNNVINDLSTTISKATNDGVTPKLFNQFMADFSNIVKDNPDVSDAFTKQFVRFVNKLNLDIVSGDKQSQILSKLVMFNSKYMSAHK